MRNSHISKIFWSALCKMLTFSLGITASLAMLTCFVLADGSTNETRKDLAQQHSLLQRNQVQMMKDIRAILKEEKEECNKEAFKELGERMTNIERMEKHRAEKDKERGERMSKLEKIVGSFQQLGMSVGSVFTRWGRTDCPLNSSELLYSGSVGGSWYDHTGAATTYLCLPQNPQRLKNLPHSNAYLYGGEYDAPNDFRNGFTNGDDMPCAVCQSKTGSQKMMIPARIECLSGWTKQYAGYLGTGAYVHKSSKEYICVDENPQAANKGHRNDNGALVYSVKAVCGSLPCPPFKTGDTVTCVVCTN